MTVSAADRTPPDPMAKATKCVARKGTSVSGGNSNRAGTLLPLSSGVGLVTMGPSKASIGSSPFLLPKYTSYASTFVSSLDRSTSMKPAIRNLRVSTSVKDKPRGGGGYTRSTTGAAASNASPAWLFTITRRWLAPAGGDVPLGKVKHGSVSASASLFSIGDRLDRTSVSEEPQCKDRKSAASCIDTSCSKRRVPLTTPAFRSSSWNIALWVTPMIGGPIHLGDCLWVIAACGQSLWQDGTQSSTVAQKNSFFAAHTRGVVLRAGFSLKASISLSERPGASAHQCGSKPPSFSSLTVRRGH
mmetsp:Transcript_100762/g.158859  ORF Transcript_100762/g.158859 Transcript_100762/m.158859 type:complete len:301 (-) Transcript_100762:66-968(-)